ncbi:MAG TPA: hypothetical protein VLN59_11265 [Burkholderiales bacterium]|nr:hypothetical protein [Burkholderiales bacterium]
MRNLAIGFAITLFCSGLAYPADALIGKYSGSVTYPGRRGDTPIGLELVIESIESGTVKAKAAYSMRGPCAGEYLMAGTYADNKLRLKSIENSGRTGDCVLILNLAAEGNSLVGATASGYRVQLSR